jgi:hypothetical protein
MVCQFLNGMVPLRPLRPELNGQDPFQICGCLCQARKTSTLADHLGYVFFCIILEEYVKFYAWKYEWRVDYRDPICGLCERLNTIAQPEAIVNLDDIAKNAGCKTGEELPWMVTR